MPISFIPYTAVYGPLSIPGVTCQLWLDGADSTTLVQSGGTVSQWSDKSGSGRHITQATTGNQPTYSSNSNAVVFTGTQYLNIPNALAAITPAYTIFVVERRASANVMFFIGQYNLMSGNTALILGYNATNISHHTTAYISDCQVTIPSYAGASEPIKLNRYDYTGSTRSTFINGGSLSTTQSFSATLPVWSNANVGIGFGTAYGYIGNIHEIIFYNVSLTTPQQQAIEGYLAQKWGLTSQLPAGHPALSQTFYNGKVYQPQISLKPAPYANYFPLSVAGCAFWLDAADITTMTFNGSSIIQWNDKSPSSNYVSQATVANAPTLGTSQNGLNTVYFATTNQQLVSSQNSPTPGNASRTVIALFWCPTLSSQYMSVTGTESGANPAPAWGMAKNANADVDYPFMYSSAGYDQYTFVYSTPNPLLTYAQYDSGISFFSGYYATAGATGGTTTVGNFATRTMTFNTTAGVWYIGRRQQAATGSVTSHLLEMIQYTRALTTAERQQVEGYLAWKWGLTNLLPLTHPYYSSAPLQYTRGAILGAPTALTGIINTYTNYIGMTLTGSSAGAVTNYQIPITVYRTTGTNSGSSVYLGTTIYSDYSNLYFLASDQVTKLPFYIESSTITATSALIWVSVSTIPASPSTVKVYLYWYVSGTNPISQNGTNTFLLFDDFTGSASAAPNSSIWTLTIKGSGGTGALTGSGTVQLSPTNSTISSVSLLSVNTLPANNFCIHVRRQFSGIQYTDITFAQTNSVQDLDTGGQSSWWHTTLAQGYLVEKQNISGQDHLMIKGATGTGGSDLTSLFGSTPVNTWELIDFSYTSSGLLTWAINGSTQASATNTTYLSGGKYLLISQGMYSSTSGYVTTVDYVFVRKYVSPEPSVTAWGALNTP